MSSPTVTRRALLGAAVVAPFVARPSPAAPAKPLSAQDRRTLAAIEAHRPSRLKRLPVDFAARFGATHVAGKYCLTDRPFLVEGAERLLALGTRLGKFWFDVQNAPTDYPFHSKWGKYTTLTELARSDSFARVFALPFRTILLEAMTPAEHGWRDRDHPERFYDGITKDFEDLTTHLYQTYRDRPLTFVLQNWEGDWLLRGAFKEWDQPPAQWRTWAARMRRWLAARQRGVTRGRAAVGTGAKCVVAHAAEVNKVADGWKGVPTMTRDVLPHVEVDLVSYSAYDTFHDPLAFWKAIADLRAHARTGPLFGRGAVAVGEYGIPENRDPDRIEERYDRALGVMLAAGVWFAAHWQLYCNEFADGPLPTPVTDARRLRGFWLVKPDGSLGVGGRYHEALWKRAASQGDAER